MALDDEQRAARVDFDESPFRTSTNDVTFKFDQMHMGDSFLLDEHSYDNYLNDVDDEISFTVPPFSSRNQAFTSSTPIARKMNQQGVPKNKVQLLRREEDIDPDNPAGAETPRATYNQRVHKAAKHSLPSKEHTLSSSTFEKDDSTGVEVLSSKENAVQNPGRFRETLVQLPVGNIRATGIPKLKSHSLLTSHSQGVHAPSIPATFVASAVAPPSIVSSTPLDPKTPSAARLAAAFSAFDSTLYSQRANSTTSVQVAGDSLAITSSPAMVSSKPPTPPPNQTRSAKAIAPSHDQRLLEHLVEENDEASYENAVNYQDYTAISSHEIPNSGSTPKLAYLELRTPSRGSPPSPPTQSKASNVSEFLSCNTLPVESSAAEPEALRTPYEPFQEHGASRSPDLEKPTVSPSSSPIHLTESRQSPPVVDFTQPLTHRSSLSMAVSKSETRKVLEPSIPMSPNQADVEAATVEKAPFQPRSTTFHTDSHSVVISYPDTPASVSGASKIVNAAVKPPPSKREASATSAIKTAHQRARTISKSAVPSQTKATTLTPPRREAPVTTTQASAEQKASNTAETQLSRPKHAPSKSGSSAISVTSNRAKAAASGSSGTERERLAASTLSVLSKAQSEPQITAEEFPLNALLHEESPKSDPPLQNETIKGARASSPGVTVQQSDSGPAAPPRMRKSAVNRELTLVEPIPTTLFAPSSTLHMDKPLLGSVNRDSPIINDLHSNALLASNDDLPSAPASTWISTSSPQLPADSNVILLERSIDPSLPLPAKPASRQPRPSSEHPSIPLLHLPAASSSQPAPPTPPALPLTDPQRSTLKASRLGSKEKPVLKQDRPGLSQKSHHLAEEKRPRDDIRARPSNGTALLAEDVARKAREKQQPKKHVGREIVSRSRPLETRSERMTAALPKESSHKPNRMIHDGRVAPSVRKVTVVSSTTIPPAPIQELGALAPKAARAGSSVAHQNITVSNASTSVIAPPAAAEDVFTATQPSSGLVGTFSRSRSSDNVSGSKSTFRMGGVRADLGDRDVPQSALTTVRSDAVSAFHKGKERTIPSEPDGQRSLPSAPASQSSHSTRSSSSISSSASAKRLPLESPVRERILATKKTRVELKENDPPRESLSRSHRRQSGMSQASAIVVDDDSDADDALVAAEVHIASDNHRMASLHITKGKGKRISADFDDRRLAKRPRLQNMDPRRVVSHTIVTSSNFASYGRPPRGPVHRPVAMPFAGPIPGEASRMRALERDKRMRERMRVEAQREKEKKAKKVVRREPEVVPNGLMFGARKTVPQPFTFDSDLRAEKHRAEFEARLAHWEVRTREAAQSNAPRALPDYATLQAQHFAKIEAAREAAKAKVTAPKTPGLRTKVRVQERNVFDDRIREKERITIKLREARREEEEEQERRDIRELRKRLDDKVKANPVPAWYRVQANDDEIEVLEMH